MSTITTSNGQQVSSKLLQNYFRNLVNQFFKILPMRENGEETLCVYMKSLQVELLGCKELISDMRDNPRYLTLLAILQYLVDNPSCPLQDVRREVFEAISICNKLESIYTNTGVEK